MKEVAERNTVIILFLHLGIFARKKMSDANPTYDVKIVSKKFWINLEMKASEGKQIDLDKFNILSYKWKKKPKTRWCGIILERPQSNNVVECIWRRNNQFRQQFVAFK